MSELQNLGANPTVAGSGTRGSFLLKAAGVTGAAFVGGGLLAGPGTAFASSATDNVSDVDVLNFALTLEYLEATFYTQALGGRGTHGVPASHGRFDRRAVERSRLVRRHHGHHHGGHNGVYDRLRVIRDHEVGHVDFLRGALAGAAVEPCTFDFSGALANVSKFLGTAQVLENTGVMAYDGAIRYVETGDYLQAGAQIATIEARHAAYLNTVNGDSPFPDPFDMGKKPSEIVTAASQFIVTVPPAVQALFARLP